MRLPCCRRMEFTTDVAANVPNYFAGTTSE